MDPMKPVGERDGQSADAAFNRILSAEQDAREAVAACRRQAEAIIAQAEQSARAIVSRSETRIRGAHAIADRGIDRALSALGAPLEGAAPRVDAPTAEEVAVVVEVLARELTEAPR
jgi:cell division septum initiation protein DivIVA